jgi:hypothetical protein
VLLAPGDQRERDRRVDRAQHDHRLPPRPELAKRRSALAQREERDEDERGGEQSKRDQHRRLDVVQRDLDEQERGAPEAREQ